MKPAKLASPVALENAALAGLNAPDVVGPDETVAATVPEGLSTTLLFASFAPITGTVVNATPLCGVVGAGVF